MEVSRTFGKNERLCGKTSVSALLSGGHWGICGCLKYCSLIPGGGENTRILVSVPKKSFKRAVRRNLLKRRIREAYRTQKHLLCGVVADIMFVYNSEEVAPFRQIREDVAAVLNLVASKGVKGNEPA